MTTTSVEYRSDFQLTDAATYYVDELFIASVYNLIISDFQYIVHKVIYTRNHIKHIDYLI